MLSILKTTSDRFHFFFSMHTTLSWQYHCLNLSRFIHTLQLVIKNLLFVDDHKLVCHFSHSSKTCEVLRKFKTDFYPALTKQKALLLVQNE